MRECLSKYTFCFNSTCCFIFTPQSIFQVPVVSFCLPGLTLHIKNCLEGVWSTIRQGVKHVLSWLGACHDRTDRSTYCDTLKAGSTSPNTSQTFLMKEWQEGVLSGGGHILTYYYNWQCPWSKSCKPWLTRTYGTDWRGHILTLAFHQSITYSLPAWYLNEKSVHQLL